MWHVCAFDPELQLGSMEAYMSVCYHPSPVWVRSVLNGTAHELLTVVVAVCCRVVVGSVRHFFFGGIVLYVVLLCLVDSNLAT